jgi:hypothetical protein
VKIYHAKDIGSHGARIESVLIASLAGLALLGALTACKSKPPADIPGEFTFHGVAVHPAAVSALYRSTTGQIDLAEFETDLEARPWEDMPGWWVTEFEEDIATGRTPFFAYAAFAGPPGGGAELYVLSVTFNQGEPADVDNIVLLQKSGSWLGLIRAWDEGSACNGGLLSERMEGDNFLYARELTPVDLLNLSNTVRLDLAANEDLETSSESCFAAANYAYSLTEDSEILLSIRFYEEPATGESRPSHPMSSTSSRPDSGMNASGPPTPRGPRRQPIDDGPPVRILLRPLA